MPMTASLSESQGVLLPQYVVEEGNEAEAVVLPALEAEGPVQRLRIDAAGRKAPPAGRCLHFQIRSISWEPTDGILTFFRFRRFSAGTPDASPPVAEKRHDEVGPRVV